MSQYMSEREALVRFFLMPEFESEKRLAAATVVVVVVVFVVVADAAAAAAAIVCCFAVSASMCRLP